MNVEIKPHQLLALSLNQKTQKVFAQQLGGRAFVDLSLQIATLTNRVPNEAWPFGHTRYKVPFR